MDGASSHRFFFISDSAVTIDFGNVIDEEINRKVISFFNYLNVHSPLGMIEAIPAYSSLSVYFDVFALQKKIPTPGVHEWIRKELENLMTKETPVEQNNNVLVRIPVCYADEYGLDLEWIAAEKNIQIDDVINWHSSKRYRVYMLGFLPGFTYMGEVDEQIKVPRKPEPRVVSAGSVGIAGRQTGIYPFESPGGWRIVGKTPLKMFDNNRTPLCLLKAGDYVEFYPITRNEFESY